MLLEPHQVVRFFAKVKVGTLDECWPWQGAATPKGYGKLGIMLAGRKRDLLAHRVVAHLALGLDLNDRRQQANHHCDVPACCNPLHLYVGTQSENQHDSVRRGRHARARKRLA